VVNENSPLVETDWRKTISAETGLGLGVYAQFLQLASGGLGPELSAEHSNKMANIFAFNKLTTLSFEPTMGYVDEALKAPAVQAYLREPKQRFAPTVSLFLVTGLKLVTGAKIKYSTSGSMAVKGNIGINVAPLGMTFGLKGHWTRKDDDETEFSRDSEFIFAFRVKRLKFGLGRKLDIDEYNKGAFLSTGKYQDDGGREPVVMEDVDGSDNANARLVNDATENGDVYCIAT
jgi:hypothetical protein